MAHFPICFIYLSLAAIVRMPDHKAQRTDGEHVGDVDVRSELLLVKLNVGDDRLKREHAFYFCPLFLVGYPTLCAEGVASTHHHFYVDEMVRIRHIYSQTLFIPTTQARYMLSKSPVAAP